MVALVLAFFGMVLVFAEFLFNGLSFNGYTFEDALSEIVSEIEVAGDVIFNSDLITNLAFFLPVSGIYLLTELFFAAVVLYYVVSYAIPLITQLITRFSSGG